MKTIFSFLFSTLIFMNLSAIESVTNHMIHSEGEEVTDREILEILENHPSPETLFPIQLSEDSLTDETLIAIGKHCPNLIEMMIDAESISDKGVEALTRGCPNLETLFLTGNNQGLTDHGLFAIASNCRDLRRIELSVNETITDSGIIALAENCMHLFFIDVGTDCNGKLTDAQRFPLRTESL